MSNRRLSYTRQAFARRVMISRDRLFIVVEGIDLDSPFYDRICSSSGKIEDAGYQVWLAQQIKASDEGNGASGKTAVLAHFDHFKKRKQLSFTSTNGEIRSIAFMMDRDNEDITGGSRRSQHAIYTEMFDVEAEIFFRGKDSKALSTALSLDMKSADHLAAHLGDWIADLAVIWRDWIEWCCIAKATGARCGVGFSKESTINVPKYGPVDPATQAREAATVARRAVCEPADFARKQLSISRRVANRHAKGEAAKTVRGKWLPFYLIYLIGQYFGNSPYVYQGFTTIAARMYLDACDFSEDWVSYYQTRLEKLIS
ncbi:hypothetical protein [Streptomyces hokutonensis]|uniref:hypothetical protein n=1 Tax=Streptomyces hokutonensis TaxID=1306990 RepID=UPI003679C29F